MASSVINQQITQEEFNLFHAIDRRLFSVLVFSLGRDPAHATRVMALWIWLERVTLKSTIIHAILNLSYPIVDTLFDESMLCLHVAAIGPTANGSIPMLHALLKGKLIDVSLSYFIENKALVLRGVGRIVEDVCLRAFEDIIERLKSNGGSYLPPVIAEQEIGRAPMRHGPHGFDLDPYKFVVESNKAYDDRNEGNELLEEIDQVLFSKMNINGASVEGRSREEERGREVREGRGSNNKTLFLTFSKGYPISKAEVRDFFTRFFGDIIEGLHMQEVPQNEQPLYARLVVRDASMMDIVLQGQRKIKFSINGKHACARKYVRRRSESPQTPPAMD